VTEVDLDQNCQLFPALFLAQAIQTAREIERIEGVNIVKQVNGTPGLIGLKVPDEVPARRVATYFGNLSLRFLDAIFSNIQCPKFDHSLYSRSRVSLADGD
jgi:hypothetical protein